MLSPIKRYPLASFFILTYLFLIIGWLAFKAQIPLGPLLAALIVTPIAAGKEGLKTWAKRIIQWRVGPGWYLGAIGLPVLVTSAAAGLNILLGAPPPTSAMLKGWPEIIPEFIFAFLIVGLGEEPGFRGFVLPRLQARRSPLVATLILGILGTIWHLPLFITGDSPWSNIPLIFAGYFVFTWLFNGSGGSVLIVMLFHAATAAIGPIFFAAMFDGVDFIRYSWLLTGAYSLVAVLLVFLTGMARPANLWSITGEETPGSPTAEAA